MSKSKSHIALDFWKFVRLILAVLITAFLVYSISLRLNTPLDGISISIDANEEGKKLIDEKEIKAIIKHDLGFEVSLVELEKLDLYRLESLLYQNERIDEVDLYVDKRNILRVHIKQKQPIIRIDAAGMEDYYLDYKGDKVPVVDIYRVPVVTGKVDNYSKQYNLDANNNLNAILEIAKKIHDDEFLSALVEQIHVNDKNEMTLVPKIGRDKILLGNIENLDEKIYKLKTYYERGVRNIGLEKFDELDLSIRGQVIGRNKDT